MEFAEFLHNIIAERSIQNLNQSLTLQIEQAHTITCTISYIQATY